MITLKYLVLIFFVLLDFILVLLNKDKIAIGILMATIPFAAHPLANAKFPILLGLNAFIIWSIWLAQIVKKNLFNIRFTNWNVISKKLRFLYFFLIAGLLLPLIKSNYVNLNLGRYTPTESIFNFSLSVFTLIAFIKIMVNYRYDFEFQDKLMAIFILTSFLQFGSFLFNYIGYGHLLPKFLVTTTEFSETYYRFSGLLGDYELIVDYSMAVIGFALILIIKKKYIFLSMVSIFTATLIGILSGTRSFLIILAIFILFVYIYFIIKLHLYRKTFKFILQIAFISFIVIYVIENLLPAYTIFTRTSESIEYLRERNIPAAINRNLVKAFPVIFENSGFLGNGSILIYQIEGDGTVYHNLYYAVYANFGIIGLFALLYLIFSSTSLLFKIIRKTKNMNLSQESIILLALLISLFVQQMKISATRYISSMLIYAFIFLNVYYYKLKFKKLNEKSNY